MSNKIIFIHGSPRPKGNTRAMADAAIAAAKKQGAQVDEIDVTKLEFKVPGCIGCYQCQAGEEYRCALDDELAHEVARLAEYDVVVISSPVYWWSYSAQCKMFIDRMVSLAKFTPDGIVSNLQGKALAVLATGGGDMEGLKLTEAQLKTAAEFVGDLRFTSSLFANAPNEPGGLAGVPGAMEQAQDFGRELAAL